MKGAVDALPGPQGCTAEAELLLATGREHKGVPSKRYPRVVWGGAGNALPGPQGGHCRDGSRPGEWGHFLSVRQPQRGGGEGGSEVIVNGMVSVGGGGGVAEGGWSVQCSQVSAIRSRGPVPWNRVTKPVVRAVRVIGSSHEAEPQTGHTSPSRESKALIRVRSRVTACESQMCIMNLGHETRHESVLGPVSQTGVTGPGHESESRSLQVRVASPGQEHSDR